MERRVTHSLVNALREVPSFASVDERMLLTLIGDSANLYWPEGSVVFECGSPADGLYIVISGRVCVLGDNGAPVAPNRIPSRLLCSWPPNSRASLTWWNTICPSASDVRAWSGTNSFLQGL